MGFTGILAVIFVFMAGAYRTLQMRWPGHWGPILPVWAHSNPSLAAAVMVAIHLGVGARDLNPLAILTGIAVGLFVAAMLSGPYGVLFTIIPSKRRN